MPETGPLPTGSTTTLFPTETRPERGGPESLEAGFNVPVFELERWRVTLY